MIVALIKKASGAGGLRTRTPQVVFGTELGCTFISIIAVLKCWWAPEQVLPEFLIKGFTCPYSGIIIVEKVCLCVRSSFSIPL